MNKRPLLAAGIAAAAVAIPATSASAAQPVALQQAAGTSPAAIQSAVDAYRTDLGGINNGSALGSQPSGRREINWDGVPDAQAAPNNLPLNFFNTTVPRGALLSTPGLGVQVSGNAGVAPIRFDNLDPTSSNRFRTFSPQRLFTAVASNVVDVNFRVPGSGKKATVSGFGAVFTDVDRPDSSKIAYYDAAGQELARYAVPASPGQKSLSFLGVRFKTQRVARVRIWSGNGRIGQPETDARDIVAMDDFVYGEPTG
jgi:hypothetical protein